MITDKQRLDFLGKHQAGLNNPNIMRGDGGDGPHVWITYDAGGPKENTSHFYGRTYRAAIDKAINNYVPGKIQTT